MSEQTHVNDGCCCGHCEAPAPQKKQQSGTARLVRQWGPLGLAAMGLAAMLFIDEKGWLALTLGILSSLLAGYEIFWKAIKGLAKLKINEGVMMLVATVACLVLRDFREAVAIAVFFALGEQLEGIAAARSRRSIEALSALRPDKAHLLRQGREYDTVPAEDVPVGSEILVLPHERVPLDGVVVSGLSAVDTAAMTGESVPRETTAGDELLGGFVNGSGSLVVRTTAVAGDSAAERLLELVERAAAQKGSSERFLARFARIYTPVVMLLGVVVAIVPSIITGDWATWVRRGLLLLVSCCPCAVVLSVPLSFFAGMGAAARQGVLVKGSRFVEDLTKARVAVFDKTGTLTTNDFEVTELLPSAGVAPTVLLQTAVLAEQYSAHPLAKAIAGAAQHGAAQAAEVREYPGGGVRATLEEGTTILCGSKRFLEENGTACGDLPAAQVYVARDGQALGCIRLASRLHPDAPGAVAQLRKLGIAKCALLTGDEAQAARRAAEACGVEEVFAGLLPAQKLEHLKRLRQTGTTVYVGDGINDAPVLALADVGVAMGSGAQLAAESADLVLMGNSLLPLVKAMVLFRKTVRVVRANVGFALAFKAAVVAAGLVVPGTPVWLAIFADVGVMVLTVLNAARLGVLRAKAH
ncbi:MAG: cadmium-translocating P-type ATPase [Oscillospiraceae bacterium]|jgi:Cd2+/Zn2+-exporting ATPase|nr:cadmium-translocating P-type ATPase [Oscillospiraceae bacterium]